MKKFLLVLAVAGFAVACNNSGEKKDTPDTTTQAPADTATKAPADTATKAPADTATKAAGDTTKK